MMRKETNVVPVVIFTGGPVIDGQVLDFIRRLQQLPEIDLRGVFSESPVLGLRGMVIDTWRRRGPLAPAILLSYVVSAIASTLANPRSALLRYRTRKMLRPKIHFCRNIHDAEVLAVVHSLDPSLGLVYGGPIIRQELFEIPSLVTLGIHHGDAPRYRGKKTTFWAIYNGEEKVSVIIQRIGKKLDGGEIVARADVPVGKRPLPIIKMSLEKAGIDIYVNAVKEVSEGRAQFVPQPAESGPLYKDPKGSEILRFWWKYACRLFQ